MGDVASETPTTGRPVVAVGLAIVLAAFGAVILGEQPLEGVMVVVAAVLLGVALGELIYSVARYGDGWLAGAAALLTEAAMVWALYIETGHRLDLAGAEAWLATGLGCAISAFWVRSAARRGARTPPSP